MKKFINKIRNNKLLRLIGNILYSAMFIVVTLMLIVVILQRTTDNTVALGGYRMFNVATGSMVPKYEVGDVLLAKEIAPEELKVGDDIVYKGKEGGFKDKIVTHQIMSIEKVDGHYKIITKGIANEIEDPQINETQIIGRVVYKVQTLSYLGQLMKNIYLFYFLIFLPIVILVFKQIYNLINPYEEDEEEKLKKKNKNKKEISNKKTNKIETNKIETNKTKTKETEVKKENRPKIEISKEENEKIKKEIKDKIEKEIKNK